MNWRFKKQRDRGRGICEWLDRKGEDYSPTPSSIGKDTGPVFGQFYCTQDSGTWMAFGQVSPEGIRDTRKTTLKRCFLPSYEIITWYTYPHLSLRI